MKKLVIVVVFFWLIIYPPSLSRAEHHSYMDTIIKYRIDKYESTVNDFFVQYANLRMKIDSLKTLK